MSDYSFLSPPKKLLTPLIPVESAIKAQNKQILLSAAAQAKIREHMRKYPGPLTLHFDAVTGELKDIEKGKV